MYQNTDIEKNKIIADDDYVSYIDWRDDYSRHKKRSSCATKDLPASTIQANWLWDLDGMLDDPVSRTKVMLPLIMHEIELNKLSEEMKEELYCIQEDLEAGLLNDFYDYELEQIRKDLSYCFSNINE